MSDLFKFYTYPNKPDTIHGNVSSLTIHEGGEIQTSHQFSRAGIEIERRFYVSGLLEKVWKLIPDVDGFITVEYSNNLDKTETIFRFDGQYNLICDRGHFVNEYDSDNRLIVSTELSIDGTVQEKNAFYYDVRNRLILTERFNHLGTLVAREVRKYNAHGLVSWELEEPIGKVYDKIYYDYDEKGNLIQQQSFDHAGPTDLIIYEYDDNNNKVSEQFYDEKYGGGHVTTYSYDSNGKLIREIIPELSEIYYEYQFGNIARQRYIHRQNGVVTSIITTFELKFFSE